MQIHCCSETRYIPKSDRCGKKNMYVIDSKGVLQYQGAIDDAGGRGFMKKDLLNAKNYVKRALDELMSGKNVSISETRPYGCSVKYST